MKLYGFRPKSEEERELVEKAIEEGKFPSQDAFIRETVLQYISPHTDAVGLMDLIAESERRTQELKERLKNGKE